MNHIFIGTHALIQDEVNFQNLGLVITDEQHRFGVEQRRILREKGENPDVLIYDGNANSENASNNGVW